MNLTKYNLAVNTATVDQEDNKAYRLWNTENGKQLTEWITRNELVKAYYKEVAKQTGYTVNTVERMEIYLGAVIECEVGKTVEIEGSLIRKSGSRKFNSNIMGILTRNFLVSGVSREQQIVPNRVTLLREK